MFTVLSNTRNSNLYLIAALAVMAVVLLTFAVVPAISAPRQAAIPVTGISEVSADYYLRHPELGIWGVSSTIGSDFYQRHPEWVSGIEAVGIPVTGALQASDFFQRHSVLSMPAVITADTADYFIRHPELRPSVPATDLSDYFLRH